MLVRAGNDGEWLQLQPVDGFPSGGLRSLCGSDAANLLELDMPLPVAAFGPWPEGALAGVDAVCLTHEGDIELLVGTWGESPRDTLWRLVDVASTLRGTALESFASHLTELGDERSVTRWLHARVGGDATAIEARLRRALATGDFGFVLITSDGAGELAQPLQYLQHRDFRVRVFELEVLRAGDVQAIEGVEVPLAAAPTTPPPVVQVASVAATVAAPVLTVAPVPQVVPEADLVPELKHDDEPVETFFDEAEPEDAPAAPEEPSDLVSFLSIVDGLDHRTSAYVHWLHESLLRLADEAEYTTDGAQQFVTGWLHSTERVPLFVLDGRGLLQIVIASLPEDEQREYADEVAGMIPETTGSALLKAGYADIDVPANLDDQTLIEYLVDNLVEALSGGRETFSTTTRAEGIGGADFFDGVSAERDTTDAGAALTGSSSGEEEPAETETETAVEPAVEPSAEAMTPGANSRWLRRRGAA